MTEKEQNAILVRHSGNNLLKGKCSIFGFSDYLLDGHFASKQKLDQHTSGLEKNCAFSTLCNFAHGPWFATLVRIVSEPTRHIAF